MKTKYIRSGKNITDVSGDEPSNKQYRSINEAKRASRKLQNANGGLGMGFVTKA